MTMQEKLASILAYAASMASKIEVLLVVNIIGHSRQDEPSKDTSMKAKFYHPEDIVLLCDNWKKIGYNVTILKDEEELVDFLSQGKHQNRGKKCLVYNMADRSHGAGRKALLPSLCSLYGVAYCNSNAAANSLARNKYHCALLAQHCNVLVPDTWFFEEDGWFNDHRPSIETKIILKPTYECQGKGIDGNSVMIYQGDDEPIAQRYRQLCQPLTVQSFISGYEISINMLQWPNAIEPLPPVALRFQKEEYLGERYRRNEDYFQKGQDFYPYTKDEGITSIVEGSKAIHRLFGFHAVSRSDFRITKEGKAYAIDINEAPAPLPGGAYFQAALAGGLSTEEAYHSILAINVRFMENL